MTQSIQRIVACAILLTTVAGVRAQPNDDLPPRTFLRIGTLKMRHGDRIQCLAYSPDAQMLAAGGGNDPVRLWNPKTGELIREIREPWTQAIAFTPSGDTLLVAGIQRRVRLWNVKLNKEIAQLENSERGHTATVKALAVSPDGDPASTVIASADQHGKIVLWSMSTKTRWLDFVAHAGEVAALAFSPDKENSLLASAGSDRLIKLWTLEDNRDTLKHALDAGCLPLAIAFSPDGKTLYSAGDDQLIRRWDVAAGKQTGVFKGHEAAVVSLVVRDKVVISGGLDKSIRFWDAKTGDLKRTLPRGRGDCDALAVTSAGDFLATAGTNNTIRVFAVQDGKESIYGPGPQVPLAGLALSPDCQRLTAMTTEGRIIVADAAGRPAREFDCKQTGDLLFASSPDGKTFVTAAHEVRFWNAENGLSAGQFKKSGSVETLAITPNSKTIALGYSSSEIQLLGLPGQKGLGFFKYPGPLYALAWSPDGKKLAAAGSGKILIWDAAGKELLKSFDVKPGPPSNFPQVKVLAFAPDNKTLAAGCFDAQIRIYDITAKNPTETAIPRLCEGHASAILCLAFSADGRTLLSGSFDQTARLWETFSGKQIMAYKGHIGPVAGIAFVKDGRSFYSASADTTILKRDVPGLANNGKLSELTLSYQDLEAAWDILSSEDTLKAHDTMWRCIASAKQAVPHLTKYLPVEDPERVKKLFRDLDSGHYPTRFAAQNELAKKGRWMEGRYDAAIANPPSLEYKRRVEVLKEKLNAQDSPSIARERLRVRRIMLMCEQVASPDAITALQKLAEKGPEEDLREEAKLSLERLEQIKSKK